MLRLATERSGTVIVRLMGGLGNQLFQYAAGRAAAVHQQARLRLDTSWYDGRSDRSYVLSRFEIQADNLSPRETQLLRYWMDDRRHSRAKSAAKAVLPFLQVTRISDPPGAADPEVLRRPGRLFVDGYWQSPAYFSEISPLIRGEFRVNAAPDERNAEIIRRMRSCESVAIHVRRGDYVTDPAANNIHGTCGGDYYERAVELIRKRVDSPRFFVFSDDPEAARRELQLRGPAEFIDGNGGHRDWEDLRLMASCRHHVIANSTFSWWGAWLAWHDEQVVFAPRAWFRPGAKPEHSIHDLIPQSWNLVEVPQDER